MHTLHTMSIQASPAEILKRLVGNRAKHAEIVIEARKGYMEKATAAVKERLKDLESGKLVSLSFHLSPPRDHTKVYDTAIAMLELHQGGTIELTAQQVQHLIQDDWDWKEDFLAVNSAYSGTAAAAIGGRY